MIQINSPPFQKKKWKACLDLEFGCDEDHKTKLINQRHEGPLLVQKTLYPERGGVCHAVILHPPAGIAGGDELKIAINLQKSSKVVITTPGATKWYKSNGHQSSQEIQLKIGDSTHLDFLPQENIYFDECHALNVIHIYQQLNSSFIGWDMSQFGRGVEQKNWNIGQLKNEVKFFYREKLFWVESAFIDAQSPWINFNNLMDHFAVMGSMWITGCNATKELLEEISSTMPWNQNLRIGASRIEISQSQGFILIRGIAKEIEDLKNFFIQIWLNVRENISGIAPNPLRLWST